VDAGAVHAQLEELTDCMNEVGAKIHLLHAKIGRDPRAEEEGDPTLWTALAELNSGLKMMELTLEKVPLSLKQVQETLTVHQIGMGKMEVNMTATCKRCKRHLVSSNLRFVSMEKASSSQLHAPRPQTQDGAFDFGPPTHVAGGDAVQEEIRLMKAEIKQMQESKVHQGSTSGNSLFPVDSLGEIMSRLKAVETGVAAAEACTIGGAVFSTDSQVGNCITTREVLSCAMCWDLFSIMVCMEGHGLSGKERADKIFLAERGRTDSALEGELVASMTHKTPSCLHGDGSRLPRLDQGFAACKTCEQWIGAGDHVCHRNELTAQIQSCTVMAQWVRLAMQPLLLLCLPIVC
jgi:hypothetical protein